MEELLTPRDLVAMTKSTDATVRWWRHMGIGPKYIKLTERTIRYRKSDVDKWLEERYAESK